MKKDVFPILYARDLAALIRFYRDLIGMTESFRFPPEGEASFVTLTWGSASLSLGTYDVVPGLEARDQRVPQAGRGFELCLYVPDVDATVARLQAAGTTLLVPPWINPGANASPTSRTPKATPSCSPPPPPRPTSIARKQPPRIEDREGQPAGTRNVPNLIRALSGPSEARTRLLRKQSLVSHG